ncbi:hypothetical protein ABEB36_000947 [Hypothenemus hampei]|uniref:Uncharacterized protein n=1 Tax=Hypothenemus hampei TaxID=57062 RepID=A0ABD1FDK2_HYPHA
MIRYALQERVEIIKTLHDRLAEPIIRRLVQKFAITELVTGRRKAFIEVSDQLKMLVQIGIAAYLEKCTSRFLRCN